jgi:hypothetical protein
MIGPSGRCVNSVEAEAGVSRVGLVGMRRRSTNGSLIMRGADRFNARRGAGLRPMSLISRAAISGG